MGRDLVRAGMVTNLTLTARNSIQCPYIEKRKLISFGKIVVGVVFDTVVSGKLVGYDAVDNTGKECFVDRKEASREAWCGTLLTSSCSFCKSLLHQFPCVTYT